MGYAEYLKELLSPLGMYDLETGAGAEEIRAAGTALDYVFDRLELIEREAMLPSAESFGITSLEELFPLAPGTGGIEDRKRAIKALISIDGKSFTEEALNRTIPGCGVDAEVRETEEHYVVEVSFPNNRGIPDGIDELKRRVESILPCHLGVAYRYIYLTWQMLEPRFTSWAQLTAAAPDWDRLERL